MGRDVDTTAPPLGTVAPDAIVRGIYRAFEVRDLARIGSLLAVDVEVLRAGGETPARLDGRAEVLTYLSEIVARTGGRFAIGLQRLLTHRSGWVVAFHEFTAGPAEFSTGCALFEVRGDTVSLIVGLSPTPRSS